MRTGSRAGGCLALLGIIMFLLFYPFEILIGPDWIVRVVGEDGSPLDQVTVTEFWKQYSPESPSYEENQTTGPDGTVHFPPRTMRANFALRFASCVSNFAESPHAGCGAHAYLLASKCNYGTLLTDVGRTTGDNWQGWAHHVKGTLFLRRCPPGSSGLGCFPNALMGSKTCSGGP
jgi:hypothetical protein